jgi:hypothetical protein
MHYIAVSISLASRLVALRVVILFFRVSDLTG